MLTLLRLKSSSPDVGLGGAVRRRATLPRSGRSGAFPGGSGQPLRVPPVGRGSWGAAPPGVGSRGAGVGLRVGRGFRARLRGAWLRRRLRACRLRGQPGGVRPSVSTGFGRSVSGGVRPASGPASVLARRASGRLPPRAGRALVPNRAVGLGQPARTLFPPGGSTAHSAAVSRRAGWLGVGPGLQPGKSAPVSSRKSECSEQAARGSHGSAWN